jgi:hypothetical protein
LPGSASIAVELQVAAPPTVEIVSPANGLIADFGAAVPFAGTVTDSFDDDPTASLTWISDRDGAIGTGGSFDRSSLSLGVHVITASYTDSHGLSDSATVTITVEILP